MTEKPSYREAIGAAKGFLDGELPEDVIRRARGAERLSCADGISITDIEWLIGRVKQLEGENKLLKKRIIELEKRYG